MGREASASGVRRPSERSAWTVDFRAVALGLLWVLPGQPQDSGAAPLFHMLSLIHT